MNEQEINESEALALVSGMYWTSDHMEDATDKGEVVWVYEVVVWVEDVPYCEVNKSLAVAICKAWSRVTKTDG